MDTNLNEKTTLNVKLTEIEKADMEFCLICCSNVPILSIENKFSGNILGNNLFVIFLLKNILQIGDNQLEEYLREFGDDPVNWISLCEQCKQFASKALNLHCQIVKFDRELWSIQKLIVEKTKQSSLQILTADQYENVWGRIRKFVKNSAFQCGSIPANPFIQGDKLATENYYFKQEILSFDNQENLEDDNELIDSLAGHPPKIKIEQSNSQLNFDDNDDDWQMVDIDDKDNNELNSEDVRITASKKKRYLYNRKKINGKIKCNYCSKLFSSHSGCTRHEQEKHASVQNQYSCQICGKSWNSREYLRRHKARSHKVGLNNVTADVKDKAPVLKVIKKFVKEPRLKINGKVKCYYCDKLFFKSSSCLRHEAEIHPSIRAQFPCEICGKAWNSREYLVTHRRNVHKLGSLAKELNITETTLTTEGADDYDIQNSPKPLEFGNQEDEDKVKKEDEQLSILPKLKTELNDDTNNIENKMMKAIGKLVLLKESPKLSDEDNKKGRFCCRVCKKVFPDRYHLKRHERLFRLDNVQSERNNRLKYKYKCELCEKIFYSRECFKWHKWSKHEASFSGKEIVKRFGCKICEKKFQSRSNLERHENYHKKLNENSQIKRVKVKVIEKTKKRTVPVKTTNFQTRKPTNARNFEWANGKVKCETCEKEFKQTRTLIEHERTHKFHEYLSKNLNVNGQDFGIKIRRKSKFEWVEGKVKCQKCGNLFSSPKTLYKHEKVKHPEIPGQYICDLCGRRCDSKEYLQSHRKRSHGVRADGSPYLSKSNKNGRQEGYGRKLKDGKGVRGRKYLAVDGKLKCRSCDKLFLSADGVYKHEQEKHPKVPGSFVCTHCGMTFNSMEYLRVHTERKHWLKLDGSQHIPYWIAKKMNKEKEIEQHRGEQDLSTIENEKDTLHG